MGDLATGVRSKRLAGDIPADVLPGLSNTYQTSEGGRKTEDDALARFTRLPRLTPREKRLIKLDQIATNPKLHPTMKVKNRPARTIWQPMARAAWIASQPEVGMKTIQVYETLNKSSKIIQASILAGKNPRILE